MDEAPGRAAGAVGVIIGEWTRTPETVRSEGREGIGDAAKVVREWFGV